MALREIIFRGKRLDKGAWVEGFFAEKKDPLLESDVRNAFILAQANGDSFVWFPVDPSTVGQFAGLMDKNGTRIFEGDVLKDDWGKAYEVFFNARNCSFMVKLEHATNEWEIGNYRLGEDWSDTIRVIGNIHDNPELLEVNEND